MYSDTGNTTSLVLGFPIRTSSDPRSVGSSPRHIAASHVLHRPLMPRHPPCALIHLHTKKTLDKKLQTTAFCLDARNHYPIKQTPHPTTKRGNNTPTPITWSHHQGLPAGGVDCSRFPQGGEEAAGLLSQSPTVCLAIPRTSNPPKRKDPAPEFVFVVCTRPPPTTGDRPSNESLESR